MESGSCPCCTWEDAATGGTRPCRAHRLHPATLVLQAPACRLSDPVTESRGWAQLSKASSPPLSFRSSKTRNFCIEAGSQPPFPTQRVAAASVAGLGIARALCRSRKARAGSYCPVKAPSVGVCPLPCGDAPPGRALPTRRRALTCIAPIFSISWSALEAPSRTELTPSLRRHQAGAGGRAEPERSPAAPGSPPPATPGPPTPYRWRAGAGCSPGARRWPAAPSASPAAAGLPRSGSCPSATGIPGGGGRGLGGSVIVGLGCTGTMRREGIPRLPGLWFPDLSLPWGPCDPHPLPRLCPFHRGPPGPGSPSVRRGSRGGSPRRTSPKRCRRPAGTRSWLQRLRAEQSKGG